jgi:hypothetical protein
MMMKLQNISNTFCKDGGCEYFRWNSIEAARVLISRDDFYSLSGTGW